MTLSEFKAWFEGFTEGMDGPPSLKQWERIQARVKDISGQAVTYPVFIDRYVEPYRRWYYAAGTNGGVNIGYSAGSCTLQNGVGNAVVLDERTTGYQSGTLAARDFDSHKAMASLGRTEAQALAA